MYKFFEKMWQRRNRDQIKKIDEIVRIINGETPTWFLEDDGKESRMDRKINIAIRIYRLRREDVQTMRNIAWIAFAIIGAIFTIAKM